MIAPLFALNTALSIPFICINNKYNQQEIIMHFPDFLLPSPVVWNIMWGYFARTRKSALIDNFYSVSIYYLLLQWEILQIELRIICEYCQQRALSLVASSDRIPRTDSQVNQRIEYCLQSSSLDTGSWSDCDQFHWAPLLWWSSHNNNMNPPCHSAQQSISGIWVGVGDLILISLT